LVLEGCTAVGKTAVAIELAKSFQTEIISADSRQVYRELKIGVARPNDDELSAVSHHFIADRSIHNRLSAGQYEREALELLDQLFKKHQVIILAGGSGLYVKALLEGLDTFPDVPPDIEQALRDELKEIGLEALLEELKQNDPEYFNEVDQNNPKRILRALAVCRASGRPYSSFRKDKAKQRDFELIRIELIRPLDELNQRINSRVDAMMEDGLLDEVRGLFDVRDLDTLDTVGYRELFEHLNGDCSLKDAIEKIKVNTRRYAKRQRTWLRKNQADIQFQPGQLEELKAYLRKRIAT
jgi:tRNA dimethylallyltransferase